MFNEHIDILVYRSNPKVQRSKHIDMLGIHIDMLGYIVNPKTPEAWRYRYVPLESSEYRYVCVGHRHIDMCHEHIDMFNEHIDMTHENIDIFEKKCF